MPADYRLIRYRNRWYVEYRQGAQRLRRALGTADKFIAEARFGAWVAAYNRPDAGTVERLWKAYVEDNKGKAVIATMVHTWKALAPVFANVRPDDVSVDLCRLHTSQRRAKGISDGTIWTELGHLRTVLRWGENKKVVEKAPHIERPVKPMPKERHLSREEAKALIASVSLPHIRLFVILALATAARRGALLDLTWDRVNLETGMIDLRNPSIVRRHKGRALVPINRTARAALVEAQAGSVAPYVIEWAGERVRSVRKGLAAAASRAGISAVTPHVLRHTAAVWMAEAGTPMSEIAQYLGHRTSRVTEMVYARYSPNHLRGAAKALEFDDLGTFEPKRGARRVG